MRYSDNKYFSNGALLSDIYLAEDNTYMCYIFKGYYYNAELLFISVSFNEDEDGNYAPDIHMYFDDDGYTKSPLTTRALNRMRDLIYEMFDRDFGNTKINQANHILLELVCNGVEMYKKKRHILNGKCDKIKAFSKEYDAEIYFN